MPAAEVDMLSASAQQAPVLRESLSHLGLRHCQSLEYRLETQWRSSGQPGRWQRNLAKARLEPLSGQAFSLIGIILIIWNTVSVDNRPQKRVTF
jgi:hypothetical protein